MDKVKHGKADKKLDAFTEWLHQGGGTFNEIQLRSYGKCEGDGDEVRGIHAAADLKVDQPILKIPRR
jgi:hypothetical protein